MSVRDGSKALAGAMLMAASLIVGVGNASPAAAAGSCPNNNWSVKDGGRIENGFRENGVNIRTGDSTNCTSRGQGQIGHTVVLHCYVNNGGAYYWVHIRDVTNDVSGWVRIDKLRIPTERGC